MHFAKRPERSAICGGKANAAARIADEARTANLRSTASFAAERFGYEIDQRWRILETMAANPTLHRLVAETEGKTKKSPQWNALQVWLGKETSPDSLGVSASSWFITDQNGLQIARNPHSDTIGRSFRRRSYFHGGGRDYDEDDPAVLQLKPVSEPCLSAVYQSKTTYAFKVAFSVPIVSKEVDVEPVMLGVLGMSIEFGKFVRYDCLPERAALILADLRPDWLTTESKPDSGLVLDHPELRKNGIKNPKNLSRLSDSYIAEITELRKSQLIARRLGRESPQPVQTMQAELKTDFHDPVTGRTTAHCVAAIAPVFVPGRNGDHEDVGWVVLIEDCTNRAARADDLESPSPTD